MKPLTFTDIIGQKHIIDWLSVCLEKDKVPQVILFEGKAGIGKSSIAKILACEITCKGNQKLLEECKKAVILEGKSSDTVHLYNMSNLKSQDEVLKVRNDFNVGFSPTGRKAIIMDEAHGMSDEAQDSLLVTFENLPENVYVIICSTELYSFRDTFLSRCLVRRLSPLTSSEIHKLIIGEIKYRNLKFDIPQNMAVALISSYCQNEPRRANVFLDSLDNTRVITKEDLTSYDIIQNDKTMATLIKYLYNGDALNGISFINEISGLSQTSLSTLVALLQVAYGGQSYLVSGEVAIYIRDLIAREGIDKLLRFTIDLTTSKRLTKNFCIGIFLKYAMINHNIPAPVKDTKMQDLSLMQNMITSKEVEVEKSNNVVASLEELLQQSDTAE